MSDDPTKGTEEQAEGGRWFGRLKSGLGRSSDKLTGGIADIFTKRKLDEESLAELEELLIMADLGPATAANHTFGGPGRLYLWWPPDRTARAVETGHS